jgi:hypothetical protein
MHARIRGFTEELIKTADLKQLVEQAIGAPGSPMRKAIGRAALLGAGTTAVHTALKPEEAGDRRHYLQNMLAGAAAGAVTGRAFPSWYGRAAMVPQE